MSAIRVYQTSVYFVKNGDSNPAAVSLIQKMQGRCKPGALIMLTAEEFEVLQNDVIAYPAIGLFEQVADKGAPT